MPRLGWAFWVPLAISSFQRGLAGPACAKKNYQLANCVQLCKSKWGWSGMMMGTDPWGSVMQKTENTDDAWDAVISKACGTVAHISSTPSSVSSAVPVQSVQPTVVTVISQTQTAAPSGTSSSASTSTSASATFSTSTQKFLASLSSHYRSTSSTYTISTSSAPPPTVPAQAATTSQQPQRPVTAAPADNPPPSSGGGTSDGDIQAYLSAHNSVRAQNGAAALSWNANLASKAQQWANDCNFQHSGGSLGPFGENLAAGTGSAYDIAAAIKSWTDEVSEYNSNNPVPSHFTQVVWKGTSQVGCAVQLCDGIFDPTFGKAKFFVCEYQAQGNVIGQFAQNVQA
ncbi:hypothetical protein K443DRAFT_424528 [Laccaria amethystina LaAM-08-1]|uniref:SCP domain-containing protein n=1 Tax=Laccaria amethystina LaAM-08-1 TaxID=1095629 RepID=A0A0C9XH06_9AGAR|nr:hypothetical protein K443DRAFT_424528 [Laccaria amethystina LaAM-08-1]